MFLETHTRSDSTFFSGWTGKTRLFGLFTVMFASPVQAEDDLWRLCASPQKVSPSNADALAIPDVSADRSNSKPPSREMTFTADQVNVTGSRYRMEGKVTGRRGNQLLSADILDYDKKSDIARVEGHVRIEQSGRTMTGDNAELNIAKNSGFISPARFWIADRHLRGGADTLYIESDSVTRLEGGMVTTCDEGSNDWLLKASSLRLDTEKNEGVARHARIEFMHVPIFYFPYLSFPLEGRKTGFLVPTIGDSDTSGTELSIPYYWNMAPHRDATFTPQFLSRRGLLMEGEFRYLNKRNSGIISVEHIKDDQIYGDDRSAVSFRHQGEPATGWRTRLNYRSVSDSEYLDDFSSDIGSSSTTHLERSAHVDFRNQYLQAMLLIQAYQTVDDMLPSTSKPYERLPQLQLNFRDWTAPGGIQAGLSSELVKFDRSEGVVGKRLDVQPRLSWPVRKAAGFVVPKLSYRHTQYQLDHSDPAFDDTPSRGLPLFSVDSGLIFERELGDTGRAKRQTLEPRLFYLNVPYRDQENLIVDESGVDSVFDTGLSPLSFDQLFRENRFTGADRIGDANQINAALTTRYLDNQGSELFRGSIGQIFYLQDREVSLPGYDIETAETSDWVAEISSHWTKSISARASIQWDPETEKMERSSANLMYQKDNNRLVSLAYRFEDSNVEQGDIALIWPVAKHWGLVGRWLHSFHDDVTLETLKGLEYESCCWTIRIVHRQYRVDALEENMNNSIWFQLDLKGLTSVGNPVKDLLVRDILRP